MTCTRDRAPELNFFEPHAQGIPTMPQLTLGWLTLLNTRTADVIPAAAAAGFKSVSIRITGRKPGESYDPIVGNPAAIRELKQQLAACGMRLSNTSIFHLYPDVTMEH